MSDPLSVRSLKIERLVPDPQNARTHSERNLDAIKRSLSQFGQRKPIVVAPASDGSGRFVVVAGNGTLEAAKALGWSQIAVADIPSDWDADRARAYAIADNRTAELADWDQVVLSTALVDLDAVGWDIKDLGFETLDPAAADPENGSTEGLMYGEENLYTKAVNIPQYEIVGDRPAIAELLDDSRAQRIRDSIAARYDLDPEVRRFLLAAADRHVRFNYRKIAEFYPHATPDVQRMMEESALVIIDVEDAIRLGYAKFADTIAALEEEDRRG